MKGQRRKRSQERDPGSPEPGTSTKGLPLESECCSEVKEEG